MKRTPVGNIAPKWPFCSICDTLKADGYLDEIRPDGTTIKHPICQPCAFEKGFVIPERFVRVWSR